MKERYRLMRMITVDSIVGSVRAGGALKEKYDALAAVGAVEKIRITRFECDRVRMRKTTDRGTDVAVTLPAGSRLRHGDVLAALGSRIIVVEVEPEKVACVRLKAGTGARASALAGHAIGNLHRPIKVEEDKDATKIYFPIQSDDEIAMVGRMLAPLQASVTGEVRLFEPEEIARVHEH